MTNVSSIKIRFRNETSKHAIFYFIAFLVYKGANFPPELLISVSIFWLNYSNVTPDCKLFVYAPTYSRCNRYAK